MDRDLVEEIKRYYSSCIAGWEGETEYHAKLKVDLMTGFVRQLDRILSSK